MYSRKTLIKTILVFMFLVNSASFSQVQIIRQLAGSGGGAIFQTTADLSVNSTIGQPVISLKINPPLSVIEGFWSTFPLFLSVETPKQTEVKKTISNFPNPVNNTTTFSYRLDAPGRVTLKIYDITGQEMMTLIDDYQNQGEQKIDWDVKGSNGLLTPSGTYLYELNVTTSGNTQSNYNLRNILVISR